MKILIEKGHIIDPSQGFDGIGDVLIEDGKIKEIRWSDTATRRNGEIEIFGVLLQGLRTPNSEVTRRTI